MAITQFVSPSDLPQYVNPYALQDVAPAILSQACNDANEAANSYMRGRFPVDAGAISYGTDVKRYTAYIAIYQALQARGMNPSAGADSSIETNYREAVGYPDRPGSGWWPAVSRGSITPNIVWTTPPSPTYQLPQVYSSRPRGW